MVISSVCAWIFAQKYIRTGYSKVIVFVLSILLSLPVGFLTFIDGMFGNFGQKTVVRTEPSPGNNYRAEVIDSDQGALGGDTYVDVHDLRAGIDLYFLKMVKKPQRVYAGEWGEHANMSLSWIDNQTLQINGIVHKLVE